MIIVKGIETETRCLSERIGMNVCDIKISHGSRLRLGRVNREKIYKVALQKAVGLRKTADRSYSEAVSTEYHLLSYDSVSITIALYNSSPFLMFRLYVQHEQHEGQEADFERASAR
jgi:hypothetical protein